MYFIFDANNNPVGNPKGYSTSAQAERVINNPRTKAHKAIWATFDACRSANPGHTKIYRITAEGARP